MSKQNAAVIIGIVVAFAVAAVVIGVIWFCKTHRRNLGGCDININSETGSSDPSALGVIASASIQGMQHGLTEFLLGELEEATKNFGDSNLIGHGSFGPVYKGLLRDTIVAIKRRPGSLHPRFLAEVTYLSEIRHRNLVRLFGYCCGDGHQMLVYEYLPNQSLRTHLHDTENKSSMEMEFRQRLSIALGAAKGLHHLHSLNPPLLHKRFKTANVLVDQDFNAKVADAGMARFLEMSEEAGPSRVQKNVFRDPEVGSVLETFAETSDVYSFGVFLLELVSGEEPPESNAFASNEGLAQWIGPLLSTDTLVDPRIRETYTADAMRDVVKITLECLRFPGTRRPRMEEVAAELERVYDKERALTTFTGESTANITLGSELFA